MILNPNVITDIKSIINKARDKAIRAVDTERVLMYWHIGQRIFLEEQDGKDRAEYGKFIIKYLSGQLQSEVGSGFSSRQLERYRQFYRLFPITSTLSTQLTWSHYMHLLGIENQNSRDFYMAESVTNNWSSRQTTQLLSSPYLKTIALSWTANISYTCRQRNSSFKR